MKKLFLSALLFSLILAGHSATMNPGGVTSQTLAVPPAPVAAFNIDTAKIIGEGDSLTKGYPFYTNCWFVQLSNWIPGATFTNVAADGSTFANVTGRVVNVWNNRRSAGGLTNTVVLVTVGVNDLWQGTISNVPGYFANLEGLWKTYRSWGLKVAVGTVTPHRDYLGTQYENTRADLNGLIRQSTNIDYVIDFAESTFPTANTAFWQDQVHWTVKTHTKFSEMVFRTLKGGSSYVWTRFPADTSGSSGQVATLRDNGNGPFVTWETPGGGYKYAAAGTLRYASEMVAFNWCDHSTVPDPAGGDGGSVIGLPDALLGGSNAQPNLHLQVPVGAGWSNLVSTIFYEIETTNGCGAGCAMMLTVRTRHVNTTNRTYSANTDSLATSTGSPVTNGVFYSFTVTNSFADDWSPRDVHYYFSAPAYANLTYRFWLLRVHMLGY